MNALAYAISWLLPAATGAAVYLAFSPGRVAGRACTAFGYGTPLGLLLAGLCASLTSRNEIDTAWLRASPLLLLIAIVAAVVAWRRGFRWRAIAANETDAGTRAPVAPRWQRWFLGVLMASLVARTVVILREVWLRPIYPWDAWSAWAVKAKTWVLSGHYVSFVSLRDWIAQSPSANLRTGVAWNYPDALAWIDVWFASAAGGWIEPMINFAWPGAWLALLLAHFGQWRALGMMRERALFFVYILGSLPLLAVHAAIAGYADLWVALFLSLAVLAWTRWLQRREAAQLLLAVACALVMPWVKAEGAIWCAALLCGMAFGALPTRWRWRVAVAALSIGVLLIAGGLRWLLGALGFIDASGAIVDSRAGKFALLFNPSLHPVAVAGVLRSMFTLPNWNLLWWLLPAIVIWRRRELVSHDWLALPALLMLVCIGALMFLFLGTAAAEWAQSFTAINRLVLQLTPAMCSLLALLMRDAALPARAIDTAREPAAHSDPA
jgi:hypothetical protein